MAVAGVFGRKPTAVVHAILPTENHSFQLQQYSFIWAALYLSSTRFKVINDLFKNKNIKLTVIHSTIIHYIPLTTI